MTVQANTDREALLGSMGKRRSWYIGSTKEVVCCPIDTNKPCPTQGLQSLLVHEYEIGREGIYRVSPNVGRASLSAVSTL